MIVLADRGSEQKIIIEERDDWVVEVLAALGVRKEAFDLDQEDMKKYLSSIEIEIWKNPDNSIDIYHHEEIVAQWKVPKLTLIKEGKSKWYYEININAWARPLQKLNI